MYLGHIYNIVMVCSSTPEVGINYFPIIFAFIIRVAVHTYVLEICVTYQNTVWYLAVTLLYPH